MAKAKHFQITVNIDNICTQSLKIWAFKFFKSRLIFGSEHRWKNNFEVLVWISATNILTAVVKMHELPQYDVRHVSRVWGTDSMSTNFWRISLGTDL